jgi:hypothetical protein
MGLPPSAQAGYPKLAGAFCHGVVGNPNVASPTPNPGRTWPGAGWSVGKMWAIRTWHVPRRILVVLVQVQAGRRENVGNSNVACPMPNPGRTWPGAGWAVGEMWANHYLCGKRVKNEQLARAISRVCAKSTIGDVCPSRHHRVCRASVENHLR